MSRATKRRVEREAESERRAYSSSYRGRVRKTKAQKKADKKLRARALMKRQWREWVVGLGKEARRSCEELSAPSTYIKDVYTAMAGKTMRLPLCLRKGVR